MRFHNFRNLTGYYHYNNFILIWWHCVWECQKGNKDSEESLRFSTDKMIWKNKYNVRDVGNGIIAGKKKVAKVFQ